MSPIWQNYWDLGDRIQSLEAIIKETEWLCKQAEGARAKALAMQARDELQKAHKMLCAVHGTMHKALGSGGRL